MKAFEICVVFVALFGALSAQGLSEEQKQKIIKYRQECIAETKVNPELIDLADQGDFKDDKALKCFSKCFYQKAGFVDDKGELIVDAIKAKIPEETREEALKVLEGCRKVKGADACETVYLVHKCYFEETHKNAPVPPAQPAPGQATQPTPAPAQPAAAAASATKP